MHSVVRVHSSMHNMCHVHNTICMFLNTCINVDKQAYMYVHLLGHWQSCLRNLRQSYVLYCCVRSCMHYMLFIVVLRAWLSHKWWYVNTNLIPMVIQPTAFSSYWTKRISKKLGYYKVSASDSVQMADHQNSSLNLECDRSACVLGQNMYFNIIAPLQQEGVNG